MANTVNGVSAISAASEREITGLDFSAYALRGYAQGRALRARVSIDTTGAFKVDDPQVANGTGNISLTQHIFVVGMRVLNGAANTVTPSSKVGAATAVSFAPLEFAANSGLVSPVAPHVLFETDAGGAFQVDVSGVSGGDPWVADIYYVIADAFRFIGS